MELVDTLKTKCYELEKKIGSQEQTEKILSTVQNQPSHLRALVDIEDLFSHPYPNELQILNQDVTDIEIAIIQNREEVYKKFKNGQGDAASTPQKRGDRKSHVVSSSLALTSRKVQNTLGV